MKDGDFPLRKLQTLTRGYPFGDGWEKQQMVMEWGDGLLEAFFTLESHVGKRRVLTDIRVV